MESYVSLSWSAFGAFSYVVQISPPHFSFITKKKLLDEIKNEQAHG